MLTIDHLVIVPYHPQANGIVERRKAEVMKHLRALVFEKRIKPLWSRFLPLVQRILNYTIDGSIGTQPARVIFGDMIPSQVAMDIPASWEGRPIEDYLETLRSAQESLIGSTQDYLAKNQRKRALNGKVSKNAGAPIEVGDYVLVRYPARPPNKLSGLYRGPLIVLAKERDDILDLLDLVTNKRIQVHVERLVPFETSPDVTPAQLVELAGIDVDEFVVDHIIDHRENGRQHRHWEFLVRWQAYEPSEDSWLPWRDVKDLAAMDVYSREHPELNLG
jgi:hypothetical protein